MDYDGFLNKYMGRPIDWDGLYGPQCVDLVAQYCADNKKPVAYANAKDWANHPALQGAFDWIDNDPNDPGQLPARGDIIVWNGSLPGSGGYGHIAIWDMVTAPHRFNSLDQNWGGQVVHFQGHNWSWVVGWWHVKAEPVPVPAPLPAPDPSAPVPEPAPEQLPPVIFPAPEATPDTLPVPPVDSTPVPDSPPVPTPDGGTGEVITPDTLPPATEEQPHTQVQFLARLLSILLGILNVFRRRKR